MFPGIKPNFFSISNERDGTVQNGIITEILALKISYKNSYLELVISFQTVSNNISSVSKRFNEIIEIE
jgi:hypothetical protein